MSTEPDRDALAELYDEHFTSLVRVAFLLTGSAAAAEDAVQEVFTRVARRGQPLEHPPSYLRTAVVNECRTQHRLRQRTYALASIDDELPHDLMETRDALAALNERQRTAVVLRYFVDIPDDEIAAILGCRPSTVRSLIHRALQQLEETLR